MTEKIHTWAAWISGYGRFTFDAADRGAATEIAEQKRRHERARNKLVWRTDLPTEYDILTAEIAEGFGRGEGVSAGKMRQRVVARHKL